jgi:hypothetical protein
MFNRLSYFCAWSRYRRARPHPSHLFSRLAAARRAAIIDTHHPVGYHAGKKVKDIKRNAVADTLHFAFSKAEAATLSLKQHGHADR